MSNLKALQTTVKRARAPLRPCRTGRNVNKQERFSGNFQVFLFSYKKLARMKKNLTLMLRRLYSTKNVQLKSAICIVGQTASKVSRTVMPEIEIQKLVEQGPSPIENNFIQRNLCSNKLLGSSIGKYKASKKL